MNRRWWWLSVVGAVACVGETPELSGVAGLESSGSSGASDAMDVEGSSAGSSGASDAMDAAGSGTGSTADPAADSGSEDATGTMATCGDGEVDDAEECDGPAPDEETCGNGVLDAGEACDDTAPGPGICESLGYSSGALSCVGCQLDVSKCGPIPGMVKVPGGVFEMGSSEGDPGSHTDEHPKRHVQVDELWMDRTEVTVAEYSMCVADGVCTPPGTDDNCNWMVAGREEHPVNCVSWDQATVYCAWAGKQLPTEAQWEKAARGTNAREYPWGNDAPNCSKVVMENGLGSGCGDESTMEVGSKSSGDSPYGAQDMAGNVLEWVSDWHGNYDAAQTDNPTGPMNGIHRVLRGGSWADKKESYFRTAKREKELPDRSTTVIGFRCAMSPPGT